MQHSKLASIWFPSKGYDAFCNKNEGSKLCQQTIQSFDFKQLPKKTKTLKRGNPSVNRLCHIDYLLKHRLVRQMQGVMGSVSVKQ